MAWLEEIMGQIQQSSSKKPPSQTCMYMYMYMHMYMYVEYLSMCMYVQYAIIIIADTKQRCYVRTLHDNGLNIETNSIRRTKNLNFINLFNPLA